ncbi:MAG TPA: hypothetical protein VKT53_14060 [Candidatus Acidoferrum sp.]|nr:hypothetical protein [Candidatus Acidoferrum sp.]
MRILAPELLPSRERIVHESNFKYRNSGNTGVAARGVAEMKKKPAKRKPAKQNKVRRVGPVLVHRNRTDLQLKNYLAEEHPELDVPRESQPLGRTGTAMRAERDGD